MIFFTDMPTSSVLLYNNGNEPEMKHKAFSKSQGSSASRAAHGKHEVCQCRQESEQA